MNILIVGNGFDLAHGLRTTYSNFIDYTKWIINKEIDINIPIWQARFIDLTKNNIWINYFLKKLSDLEINWIDFEMEISKVIQKLNNQYNNFIKNRVTSSEKLKKVNTADELEEVLQCNKSIENYDWESLVQHLEMHLEYLIEALELYFRYNIEEKKVNNINKQSNDIKNIDFNAILSFNYTHTYQMIYNKVLDSCYIHGETREDFSNGINNMVLGIDDYTPESELSKDVKFIRFKKYFQRIHKKTSVKYKTWINTMQSISHKSQVGNYFTYEKNNVYIFGHSLDISDKDILSEILLSDNVKTTIFYLNEEVYAQQIANLVKIIGKDKLIEKVSAIEPTIIFKKQQDMVPIN